MRRLRQDISKWSESGGALQGDRIDEWRAVPAFEENREDGRTELLGGTGKYESIAGACDYEVARVSPTVDVTTAKCTWKR